MFKLETLVRPSSLPLAREAIQRGMPVEEMCLKPTWNQRCLSCGLHHGWACQCTGEQKKRAWEEHKGRVSAPEYKNAKTRLFPNAPGLQTNVQTANTPLQTDSANTRMLRATCGCGRPTRLRGTDCWKCYRGRSR